MWPITIYIISLRVHGYSFEFIQRHPKEIDEIIKQNRSKLYLISSTNRSIKGINLPDFLNEKESLSLKNNVEAPANQSINGTEVSDSLEKKEPFPSKNDVETPANQSINGTEVSDSLEKKEPFPLKKQSPKRRKRRSGSYYCYY
jgi:hypothetical protein